MYQACEVTEQIGEGSGDPVADHQQGTGHREQPADSFESFPRPWARHQLPQIRDVHVESAVQHTVARVSHSARGGLGLNLCAKLLAHFGVTGKAQSDRESGDRGLTHTGMLAEFLGAEEYSPLWMLHKEARDSALRG